jgi:hypothetical protein
MLALSALSATWGFRLLGVSRAAAGIAAVLFALTPFAVYRNTGHFNLVIYLLPFSGDRRGLAGVDGSRGFLACPRSSRSR